ncbi:exocyst complex component Sec6-domain-containing protein [Paraphysoderma sedebokerense]|nr:exocyst complex component Sec6-domain-containing protein [Paraphysoderma sedebokerense]
MLRKPPAPTSTTSTPPPRRTPATAIAEASDLAIARLVDLFKHPDDLNVKLDTLKKKFTEEKNSIDAQLKAGTQTQLDDCQNGLNNLVNTKTELDVIRKNFTTIDSLSKSSLNMIPGFSKIKLVSRAHQNFVRTRETVIKFQELNDRVEKLRSTLEVHRKDLLGPAEDILFMHYELSRLEEFRDSTMSQVRNSNDDVVNTLRVYFRRLDELSDRFTKYIWDLANHTLDLLRNNQGSVLVRLVKIIEFEEKADEAAHAADQARNSNPELIKSYRSQFFDVLHESITERIEGLFPQFKSDIPKLLQEVRSLVLEDLTLVYDELVPRFPKKYKIFPFYVLEYHRHVYDLLNKSILENLETGTILHILRWTRDYYEDMNKKLGITEELLEPKLLDGQEQVLVDDYLKLIKQKLDEWMTNLLAAETKDFRNRENPPESDSNGIYALSAPVIMFNMINQQIDVAAESSRGRLLFDVVVECQKILEVYQKHMTEVLNSEYGKYISDRDHCPGGIIEYTVALANDNLQCSEFTEALIKRMDNEADTYYRPQISNELNRSLDGFMKLAKHACTVLTDFFFNDVKPAFNAFYTNSWYENDLMQDIIATLNDYFTDYQSHLQEYLFSKVTTDVMDRFLVSYIEAFRNKSSSGAKFRIPICYDKMKKQLNDVISFFSIYKSPKRVEKHFDIIDKLVTFICSSKKMAFLDFYALWKCYNDVPLNFIEEVLVKRDDMEKNSLREIMESIKNKAKEGSPPESQKSVFTKMIESGAKF